MAPSMVVLLNTPFILLPMRPIPNDSPRFEVFLQAKEERLFNFVTMQELCMASAHRMQCGYRTGRQKGYCIWFGFEVGEVEARVATPDHR